MASDRADSFSVDPTSLERFARGSIYRADRFYEVRNKIRKGAVGRASFGVMPAAFMLFDKYDTCLDDCMEALKDTAGAIEDVAWAVRAEVDAYEASDQAAQDQFRPGN